MSDVLEILRKYRNHNIAIYGLGIETQKLLAKLGDDFHIVGLLDGYKEEGTIYGQRIIPFSEAVGCHTKLILVVARPGSCKAIAKRIKVACIENGIDLIDVRGNDLCKEQKVSYDFADIPGITRDYLKKQIQENEVVSIDLFDTLIMRNTLFATDIFEIVDSKLKAKGIEIAEFSKKRTSSEKELAALGAPTLKDIYSRMIYDNDVQGISADELAEVEWQTDYDLLVPRKAMCDFIAEIYQQGKCVYIVSDTYYSYKQLEKMLEKCGIDCYTELLASCEYGTGKQQALFEKLKEHIGKKSCIHIGDDIMVDIDSAKAHGLNTCRIYSGLDLFEMVGYFGMWDEIRSLSDRVKTGMFIARLFNSPFQFERPDKKIAVSNAYDMGYLLMAPMITDFIFWFRQQIQKFHIRNIWFCARDGYLIKKLYDELVGDTSSVYFLTSRTAVIRAGVKNIWDIQYIESMHFSGSLQEQLKERFGIWIEEGKESYGTSLADYTEEILGEAKRKRKNYQRYIDTLQTDDGDIAFFDFVAKGTSQMYLSAIVNNHLKGLYFLQLEKENMQDRGLDIVSFYDTDELESSAIYENYYILETVLTSDKPSVAAFDESGKVIYSKETRSPDDIACIQNIQDGITDYFHNYLNISADSEPMVNRKIDEKFLELIHNLEINENRFTQMKVEDCFVNRFTDLSSLL